MSSSGNMVRVHLLFNRQQIGGTVKSCIQLQKRAAVQINKDQWEKSKLNPWNPWYIFKYIIWPSKTLLIKRPKKVANKQTCPKKFYSKCGTISSSAVLSPHIYWIKNRLMLLRGLLITEQLKSLLWLLTLGLKFIMFSTNLLCQMSSWTRFLNPPQ